MKFESRLKAIEKSIANSRKKHVCRCGASSHIGTLCDNCGWEVVVPASPIYAIKTEDSLPDSNIVYLSQKQSVFLNSKSPMVLYCGGVGSGKTYAGSIWAYEQAMKYPDVVGCITANTYQQLAKSTICVFVRYLDMRGMPYVINTRPPKKWGLKTRFTEHKGIITLRNGAQIFTFSLENYNPIRGCEFGWLWADEVRDTEEEAFHVLQSRMRGFGNIAYHTRLTTTPAGFTWLWDFFLGPEAPKGRRLPGAEYIHATSFENPFNPPGYAAQLREKLGARLAQQEIEAEFVNLAEGRAYDFERERNVKECRFNPDLPLYFAMDFNVAPLCACVMQIDIEARHVWIIDEIYIPDSGQTRDACIEFSRRWSSVDIGGGHIVRPAVAYTGDRAGGHRDTRGGESDLDIMGQVLRANFQSVQNRCDYTQHWVSDRVNAVNALLQPSENSESRLDIAKHCEYTIRDFEQVAWLKGTREIDKKSNPNNTHMSDAIGYCVIAHFPVREIIKSTRWADSFLAGEPMGKR